MLQYGPGKIWVACDTPNGHSKTKYIWMIDQYRLTPFKLQEVCPGKRRIQETVEKMGSNGCPGNPKKGDTCHFYAFNIKICFLSIYWPGNHPPWFSTKWQRVKIKISERWDIRKIFGIWFALLQAETLHQNQLSNNMVHDYN